MAAVIHPNQLYIDQAIPWLHSDATFSQALDFYEDTAKDPNCDDWTLAQLGRYDRYFLLVHILNAHYAVHPWLYARTREVEANPDGYLDLWAREHFKSTIITYAGIIQEILKDPEITIGIFSHTRPISKQFLAQIKREFESNEVLKRLYPDVCYVKPSAESPVWSLDSGIVVRRQTNPRESTIEAHGLVDGQPTGKHFKLLVYDDVVTISSVTTADQIEKTTNAWEISLNLGSADEGSARMWMIGTRYNYADTYHHLIEREAITKRIYPATDDGTIHGKPVFWSQERWEDKLRTSSLYNIACQQLQNPNAGGQAEFKPEYIRHFEIRPQTLNVYIMCDYAGSRKSTGSSRTAFAVIGVDAQLNKYLLDGACHKMGLTERWIMLKSLRAKWLRAPGVQHVSVGYERFGAQSDLEYFEEKMREGDAFAIRELNWPADGDVAKDNRIRRLEPDFRNWAFFLPYEGEPTKLQRRAMGDGLQHLIAKPIKQRDEEGRPYDLVEYLIQTEFLFFPNTTAKDLLDAMSRIYDMDYSAPMIIDQNDLMPEEVEDY
ncbi:MAG: hypothetical protein OES84_00170 [Kiritimatiellaceae bacterium]|nr:hypothetical protein [Kiritimatiellaceae bacterium]